MPSLNKTPFLSVSTHVLPSAEKLHFSASAGDTEKSGFTRTSGTYKSADKREALVLYSVLSGFKVSGVYAKSEISPLCLISSACSSFI